MAILRAADALRRRTGAVVASRGLSFHQYNVLRILRGARPAALTRAEIAERTLESVPELVELLGELAARALVRIEPGPDGHDRHALTVGGTELLAALDEPVASADREAFEGLGVDEARATVALLRRIGAGG